MEAASAPPTHGCVGWPALGMPQPTATSLPYPAQVPSLHPCPHPTFPSPGSHSRAAGDTERGSGKPLKAPTEIKINELLLIINKHP